MGVAVASAKSGACPWFKKNSPSIGDQRRLALEDEHELILLGVVVPEGGCGTWLQPGPVDAEVLQTKRVAKWTLEPPRDHESEGLRIDVLSSAWRRFGGHDERSRKRSLHGAEFSSSRDTSAAPAARQVRAARLHGARKRAQSAPDVARAAASMNQEPAGRMKVAKTESNSKCILGFGDLAIASHAGRLLRRPMTRSNVWIGSLRRGGITQR